MNKSIRPKNNNGQPHGYWEDYYVNGALAYKGHYINGKEVGYWEMYCRDTKNGIINNKTFYI